MPDKASPDCRCRLVGPTVLVLLVGAARPAAADDPGPLEADPVVDGAIVTGTALAALGLHFLRINDEPDPWDEELFGALDRRLRSQFSSRARTLSDGALAAAVAVPAALAIGTTWDAAAGDRALVFAESLGAALLLTSATKTLVGRPRPYTYNDDPDARRRMRSAGRDARRSFFSGHAATAFAALAAGGALYAGRESDPTDRALAWGAGAVLAGTTVTWRIRAGEHYYSDIVTGAVVGVAAGTIVPAIHTGGVYLPSATEWAAIGGGLVIGIAMSQLVPLDDEAVGEGRPEPEPGGLRTQLVPLVLPSGGGGLGLVGDF
jgi:membrane-associated phospholipid phosphatase